jgi:hypothetical protein
LFFSGKTGRVHIVGEFRFLQGKQSKDPAGMWGFASSLQPMRAVRRIY